MTGAYSIAEAKNNLSGLVHEAKQGHPVRLTRRGKPVAVLISPAKDGHAADPPRADSLGLQVALTDWISAGRRPRFAEATARAAFEM